MYTTVCIVCLYLHECLNGCRSRFLGINGVDHRVLRLCMFCKHIYCSIGECVCYARLYKRWEACLKSGLIIECTWILPLLLQIVLHNHVVVTGIIGGLPYYKKYSASGL